MPQNGYVPNASAAVSIAKAVLVSAVYKPIKWGFYKVEYDDINEVWIVQSFGLFRKPAYVVISKKDGKIIRAWNTK